MSIDATPEEPSPMGKHLVYKNAMRNGEIDTLVVQCQDKHEGGGTEIINGEERYVTRLHLSGVRPDHERMLVQFLNWAKERGTDGKPDIKGIKCLTICEPWNDYEPQEYRGDLLLVWHHAEEEWVFYFG